MRAILSVSDKNGLIALARGLVDRGVELISTGGTAKALATAGLPVVSSRVGGADDIVTPGESGYDFDVGDARGLIDGVRAIMAEPGRRDAMGQRARQFAETQSWPAMMDELIGCYADLIAGRHPKI